VIRVLFADDELMARRRLARLLADVDGVEVVAECASGQAALDELERVEVDVALLDVRMGEISGLDVSELAGELGVEVIFTTAHPEHAVAAFEKGAIDYVLKPIEPERLAAALARAGQRIEAGRAPRPQAAERLALTVRGEVRFVRAEDVSHALHDGSLVSVFVGGEPLLTELSLNELERRLPPRFERVHRRALLDLAHVDRLVPLPTGGYRAIVRGGHQVPVSRQSARRLRRAIDIA
jgi:two-component system LytT family response regulator